METSYPPIIEQHSTGGNGGKTEREDKPGFTADGRKGGITPSGEVEGGEFTVGSMVLWSPGTRGTCIGGGVLLGDNAGASMQAGGGCAGLTGRRGTHNTAVLAKGLFRAITAIITNQVFAACTKQTGRGVTLVDFIAAKVISGVPIWAIACVGLSEGMGEIEALSRHKHTKCIL